MGVSAIIVAYHSGAVIGGCLDSLAGIDEIIVVDNAADDTLAARAASQGFRYIRNPRNEGYGGGNNIGAAAASHDWLLLINPDGSVEPSHYDDDICLLLRRFCKGWLYRLAGNPAKAARDLAYADGFAHFLRGKPAPRNL